MNTVIQMSVCPLVLIHLFYVVALKKRDLSVIDVAWGLLFILVSLSGSYLSNFQNQRETLVTGLVLIWGLRLATFIHLRNHNRPEDFRYANWRKSWGEKANIIAYFKVYLLQYVLMLVVALPLFAVHFSANDKLSYFDYAGVAIWFFGLIWESIADYQKSSFKSRPENKNKIMTQGLWNLSRHPNYFGEATLWWGIGLVSIGSGHYWALLGPLFLNFLLLKVSGVPLVEERHKKHPSFEEYRRTTPTFIPSLSKLLKS